MEKMNKAREVIGKRMLYTLPTLEHLKDYYEIHMFDDGYGALYNTDSERYLIPSIGKGKDNYSGYNLRTKDSKTFKTYLHRMMSLAFLDGYQEGFFVDHIDGNKAHNNIRNFRWVSHKENTAKAVGVGRPKVEKKPKVYKTKLEISEGARNGNKQLTYDDVTDIFEMLNKGYSVVYIAKTMDVSDTCIRQIRLGYRWKEHPNATAN